jgi:hypothetical protein
LPRCARNDETFFNLSEIKIMAFKRTQNPTFTAPVTVNIPNDKGGFDKSTFIARFKRASNDDLAAMREMGLTNADLVRRQLVGWELKDAETQEDVPFTVDNLEAILQIEPTPLATAVAFWESVNGARSKN